MINVVLKVREDLDKLIVERDRLKLLFEVFIAMKMPALEAEFAHDEKSPLSLYDCLVPHLREHRKLIIWPEISSSKSLFDDESAKL